MEVILNVLLIMFSPVTALLGVSFWYRCRDAKKTRWEVLGYTISASLWCLGYGLIGICDNLALVPYIRVVGLLGIYGFLMCDYIFVSGRSQLSGAFVKYSRIAVFVFTLLDFYFYSDFQMDVFVRMGNWTTWYAREGFGRSLHTFYSVSMIVVLFILAMIWRRKIITKREKHFFYLILGANLIMMSFSLPDTFFVLLHTYAYPTSGFGAALSSIVIWYGARWMKTFDISIQNVMVNIFSEVNAGIIVLNEKKEVMLMNPYAQMLLRVTEGEVQSLADLFQMTKRETEMYFDMLIKRADAEIQKPARNTDTICSIKASIARDSYGEAYCYWVVVYDVTESMQMMEQLMKANQAKNDFLASVSHEIRTPINAVLGLDEMILRECKDETTIKYAMDIQVAGQSLLALINDILDFSKVEAGKLELIEGEYRLSSLIVDCYNLFRLRAQEKNLEFIVENDTHLPKTLFGDEVCIRRIVTNLVSNALKYTQKGKIVLRFFAEEKKDKQIYLGISVRDTGIGIKQENIDKLFDEFQRVDETKNRHIEGTGLGLAIVKKLVNAMDGNVSVESEYGKGSEFRVVLLQTVVDAEPVGTVELQMEPSDVSIHKETFKAPEAKILVVDDVQMNLVVFAGLLKATEVQIDKALSGSEALGMIMTKKYDLIYMDHMMPEMDGIETLRLIRQDLSHPNVQTPIIVLTANAVAGAKQEYLDAGFVDYLSKPIHSDKLEQMTMKYLPKEKVQRLEPVEEVSENEDRKKAPVYEQFSFLSVASGLSYCMEDEQFYYEVLQTYVEQDRTKILSQAFQEKNWEEYLTAVHALKSTSLTIGATELSEFAKKLEMACKNKEYNLILQEHDKLLKQYEELLQKISEALQK